MRCCSGNKLLLLLLYKSLIARIAAIARMTTIARIAVIPRIAAIVDKQTGRQTDR
jgi:hypothetical protein